MHLWVGAEGDSLSLDPFPYGECIYYDAARPPSSYALRYHVPDEERSRVCPINSNMGRADNILSETFIGLSARASDLERAVI